MFIAGGLDYMAFKGLFYNIVILSARDVRLQVISLPPEMPTSNFNCLSRITDFPVNLSTWVPALTTTNHVPAHVF